MINVMLGASVGRAANMSCRKQPSENLIVQLIEELIYETK